VLVVGPASSRRDATAQELIEHGMGVVLCSGPSLGCVLDREERCFLRDAVKVTVLFGGRAPDRLDRCRAMGGPVIDAGTHPEPMSIARRTAGAIQRTHEGAIHARF
jgi:hypothetical protein